MYFVYYDPGLPHTVLKALKDREFSFNDLVQLFQQIQNTIKKRRIIVGIICSIIIAAGLALGISILASGKSTSIADTIFMMIAFMALAYIIYLDFICFRRFQFLKAIKKHYPEYASVFTKEAFKNYDQLPTLNGQTAQPIDPTNPNQPTPPVIQQ